MGNIANSGSHRRLLMLGTATILLAGFAGGAFAAATKPKGEFTERLGVITDGLEEVQSFRISGRFHDFDVLDRETLIVWTSASRPYLIELAAPSFDLKFAHAIGIRSRMSRVYAGFDSVIVEGFSYPISKIYRLDREQALSLEALRVE